MTSYKQIQTLNDLAINGAPPAFKFPLHVGQPNIGNRKLFMQLAGEIFNRSWLTNNGPVVQQFERNIADYHSVKHCVAMCNGTVALEIAIRALSLEGEVILPSYTFVATAHALHWQAITPVFADIDPVTHNLAPKAVRRMITPRTTGIIGVHLWGNCAPVDELQSIADEYGLKLMFDAAHAFGCSYKGTMVGNFGACEVLSFHATKFFNTFEGGAILTNDDGLAQTMRLMRNFGFSGLDNVIYPGTNGKMIEIAAAMGVVNFRTLDDVLAVNYRNYRAYCKELSGLPGIRLLPYDESDRKNYQYIVVIVEDECPVSREDIVQAMHAENIRVRRYFWPGCHNMMPYKKLYPHSGLLLPNTQHVADRVVVLPTGTAIDQSMIHRVVAVIRVLIEGAS